MDLAVTIDTEADDQWHHGAPLTTKNVAFWRPFMELCSRHGVRPTYLVTTEILEDGVAGEMLAGWAREGLVEVGAHLHPWSTAPYGAQPGLRHNDVAHAFPCDLPDELLRAKLTTLSDQVGECTGARPTSFRAGRFGVDTRCARLLSELGYVVDSSVTPLVSWRDSPGLPGGGGGPDFRAQPMTPFRIDGTGESRLVELPVTIAHISPLIRRCPRLTDVYVSRPLRGARRLGRGGRRLPDPMWMRPFPGVQCWDLERLWGIAAGQGLGTAVMMFHSSELMPAGSPYRPTRRSVTALLVLLDELFTFVRSQGGSFPTLTEAARAALGGVLPVRRL